MSGDPEINKAARGSASASSPYCAFNACAGTMKAKAYSFTDRTMVFTDGTVRKNSA